MTANYHTPLAFAGPLTSAAMEAPISSLDTQITQLSGAVFNVKDHGAKGDGVTDDNAAIQAALNAANAVGGGSILFPRGVYYVSAPLTVYAGSHLVGAGPAGGQFVAGGGTKGTVIRGGLGVGIIVTEGTDLVGGDPAVSGRKEHYSIRGIRFKNGDAASAGVNALVDFRYAYNVIVEHCIFDGTSRGGTAGLVLSNSGHCYVHSNFFQDFPQHSTEAQTRAPLEISPTVSSFTGGFPVQMFDIKNNVFSYCGRGIDIGLRSGATNDGIHVVSISGNFFKKSGADPFGTDVSTGIICHSGVENLSILNAKFEDVRYPVKVVLSRNVRIDNIFGNHAETIIDVNSSADVVVDGVNISSYTGNPVTTGVRFGAAPTGRVALLGWQKYGTAATVVFDNLAGLRGAPVALAPMSGTANVVNANLAVANRVVYIPIEVKQACKVTGVRYVIGAQSGLISLGLYSSDTWPPTRLASTGSFACPAAGANSTVFTAAVTLSPGTYFLAVSADNLTATFGMATAAGLSTVGMAFFEARGAWADVPATATVTGTSGLQPTLIGLVDGSYVV